MSRVFCVLFARFLARFVCDSCLSCSSSRVQILDEKEDFKQLEDFNRKDADKSQKGIGGAAEQEDEEE